MRRKHLTPALIIQGSLLPPMNPTYGHPIWLVENCNRIAVLLFVCVQHYHVDLIGAIR